MLVAPAHRCPVSGDSDGASCGIRCTAAVSLPSRLSGVILAETLPAALPQFSSFPEILWTTEYSLSMNSFVYISSGYFLLLVIRSLSKLDTATGLDSLGMMSADCHTDANLKPTISRLTTLKCVPPVHSFDLKLNIQKPSWHLHLNISKIFKMNKQNSWFSPKPVLPDLPFPGRVHGTLPLGI